MIAAVPAPVVLMWMTRLVAPGTHCRGGGVVAEAALAEVVAAAASEDDRPLDAAGLLTSIAYHESGFCLDAFSAADDATRAYGPWQLADIWLPPLPVPLDWQARRALALARESQATCGDLTQYASGHCGGAPTIAATRESLARRLAAGTLPGVYLEPPGLTLATVEKRRANPDRRIDP